MQRTLLIVLAVVVAIVALWIAGYLVFSSEDSVPGSGTGEIVTETSP